MAIVVDNAFHGTPSAGAQVYTITFSTAAKWREIEIDITYDSTTAISTAPTSTNVTWINVSGVNHGSGVVARTEKWRGYTIPILTGEVVTITLPAAVGSVPTVVVLSGVDYVLPVEAVQTLAIAAGTTGTTNAATVTTTSNNAKIICTGGMYTNDPYQAGSGYTVLASGSAAVTPSIAIELANSATALSGTAVTPTLTNQYNSGGATISASLRAAVAIAAALSANPASIVVGESSTLTYTTTGNLVSITPAPGSVSPLNGTTVVSPTVTTTYTVTAENPLGIATANATVTITTTPTGVTATGQCGTQVRVAWNASPGAASYNVYRSAVSGSGYALVGNTAGLFLVDAVPLPWTNYYYIVKAVAGSGTETAASAEVNAQGMTIPTVTLNVVPVAQDHSVLLNWTEVPHRATFTVSRGTMHVDPEATYTPIIGVQMPPGGATFVIDTTFTGINATFFEDITALNGVQYFYKVTAVNACGSGPISTEVNATPLCCANEFGSAAIPPGSFTGTAQAPGAFAGAAPAPGSFTKVNCP